MYIYSHPQRKKYEDIGMLIGPFQRFIPFSLLRNHRSGLFYLKSTKASKKEFKKFHVTNQGQHANIQCASTNVKMASLTGFKILHCIINNGFLACTTLRFFLLGASKLMNKTGLVWLSLFPSNIYVFCSVLLQSKCMHQM